jgi:hypothetical protein
VSITGLAHNLHAAGRKSLAEQFALGLDVELRIVGCDLLLDLLPRIGVGENLGGGDALCALAFGLVDLRRVQLGNRDLNPLVDETFATVEGNQ